MGGMQAVPGAFLFPATYHWLVQHLAVLLDGNFDKASDQAQALGNAAAPGMIKNASILKRTGEWVVMVRRRDGTDIDVPGFVGDKGIPDDFIARVMLAGG